MPSFSAYIPYIVRGLGITAEAFGLGVVVCAPVALILGLMRDSGNRWLTVPATVIVEFFRGTSALVQLFWAFYALPLIGIRLAPLVAGILVIGLNEGSYASEVVRAGLRSVPAGQKEAAISLGLSRARRLWRIVLPQALPIMMPNITNAVIDLLKFTSLLSLVTVSDLTERALQIQQTTGVTLRTLGGILIVYYLFSLIIAGIMDVLERKALAHVGRPQPARRRMDWRQLVVLRRAQQQEALR